MQLNERTFIFRKKLVEFTSEQVKGQEKQHRVGYDLNAREELIRTYTEKEIELNQKLETERRKSKEKEIELKALK